MDTLKFIGAVMLILSCGGAGVCAVSELRQRIRATEKTRGILRRMQTEVCLHRLSLPEVLEVIGRDFPESIGGGCGAALEDRPFSEIWDNCVRAFALPEQAEAAVRALGIELTEVGSPETAFRNCLDELRIREEELRNRLESRGKVYIASGFAAGCMLVIAVL